MRPPTPLAVRFWPKVVRDPETECWEWTGACSYGGYGRIGAGGQRGPTLQAHRVAYELVVGPIPEGLELDHLCRNRGCVNPAHLEPVTKRVNWSRGQSAPAKNSRKTHCLRGHLFDDANTRRRGNWRDCRRCNRDRAAWAMYGLTSRELPSIATLSFAQAERLLLEAVGA